MSKKRIIYCCIGLLSFVLIYAAMYLTAFIRINRQVDYDFQPCSKIPDGLHEHVELYGETYDPNNEEHANNNVGMHILDINQDGIKD